MAKFDLKGLLNDRSVPDRQQDQKIVYRNPKDLIPSEENFYNTEKLERLKQSIKLLGILQPLLIENRDGKDYVIAGHCRRKCCIDLLNEGNDRFSRVPCIYKTHSELEQDAGKEDDIVRQIMIIQANCYGLAYEYVYVKENENNLQTKNLSAENTFMVKDDSIEENELFAVYYYIRKDDSGKLPDHYIATVVTTNYKYELDIENSNTIQATTEPAVPHYLGEIPIIEYLNNKLAIGDFELQIPLIDAYNALMSDRVTDKEQFIDAILAIYGTLLTDEDEPNTEDEDESIRKAKARLKKYKVLEMPDTAKAEYLTRTFDENGVEILKKAIEQDIHKFSHIPCMSDESFGGNVSGVAMEFKLLGMENITKIKTRYYKKGLRKRVRIFCNYLALHGISIDPSGITMTFTRALPKNLLEISQIVANLWGKVSRKTLLSQVPFVDDVDEELKALETEEEENLKRQQEVFGLQDNTPPEQDSDDKEKVDE